MMEIHRKVFTHIPKTFTSMGIFYMINAGLPRFHAALIWLTKA